MPRNFHPFLQEAVSPAPSAAKFCSWRTRYNNSHPCFCTGEAPIIRRIADREADDGARQTRTGLTKEWTKATSRGIALNIFSNLWIAWAVVSNFYLNRNNITNEIYYKFVPVASFAGFALLSRQLAHERSLPPPYTPPPGGRDESPGGIGVRRLLGTEPEDDGTHDIYSETRTHSSSSSHSGLSTDIEMREVSLQGVPPSLMQVLSSIGGTSTGSSVPSRSSLTRTDV